MHCVLMNRNPADRATDKKPKPDQQVPPAGPHGKPSQTDKEKTPGSGMLPEPDEKDVEGPSG